jgi:hypothetical protein
MKKERIYWVLLACLVFQTGCAQANGNSDRNEWPDTATGQTDSLLLAQYLTDAYCPHEIAVWMAGGLSSLNYRPHIGKANTGTGGAFGAGYTYYPAKNWGIATGAEYAFYSRTIDVDNVSNSYETGDIDGNPIIYRSHIDRYEERQRAGLLNIPLSVLYRTGKDNRYYASLGVKLGVPVYGKYTGSGGTVTTSGYYTDYRQEEIWQNDLGYGLFSIQTVEKPLKMKLSYTGTLETGVKWNMDIGTDLYTGIYMDYGLNDMIQDRGKTRFVEYSYENPAEPQINGLLTSLHSHSGSSRAFVEKVAPFAIGIKLKLAFSVACSDLLVERRRYRDMQRFHPVSVSVEPATDRVSTDIKESADTVKNDAALALSEIIITGITVETTGVNESEKEETAEYNPDFPAGITIDGYELGQIAMTPEQKSILDEYAELLRENPQMYIEITGHTCDTGTKESNLRIGQQRADSAKDYLTGKGIPPVRIFTYTKGDSEPVHPNSNEESRAKNRRLEIKLYK